ncbi:MAG: response regulator [Acidobacteriia bacterium]|nr:response regulator [Terriglobia bacterium]
MGEPSKGKREPARPGPLRSLASKFSFFSATLVFWVVATMLAYDLRQDSFGGGKAFLMLAIVVLVSAAISRFTTRLLGRPLALLQQGLAAVENGRLAPIEVSRTGDEIEYLGESFNRMIQAMAASQKQISEHQELLEKRIQERTAELEKVMRAAQEANQAKSDFLANISHELRTPMNGVIGMLDIVLGHKLAPEQMEQLQTAQSCAYSLLALLNDILDLSKIEAGKMSLEKIPFSARLVLDDCIKANLPKAASNSVELRSEVAPDVPKEIIGDPLRFRQILSNLINNAVKFTEHGTVVARIGGTFQPQGGFMLEFSVHDTGSGIPADKLLHIFDKFSQADGSVSRKYGGTGLGLAITKKLAAMHNGEIHVESELGQGSTFVVTLPFDVGDGGQPRVTDSLTANGSKPAPGLARILVVEDNPVNQRVVTAVLTKRGYSLELAGDGREALSKLEQHGDFDLVLMDVQMPALDGLEATRIIRKDARWQAIPILAMTAHAMTGDKERCLEAGMNGYISKPVQPEHLLNIVDEYLVQKTV